MTDTCATCISFLADPGGASGKCRLNPPEGNYQYNKAVLPTQWCAEFSLGAAHATGSYISQAIAANATSSFWTIIKSDNTLWISINNGISWTQVTGP